MVDELPPSDDARDDKPEKPTPKVKFTLPQMIEGVAKQALRLDGSFEAWGDVGARDDAAVLDAVMSLLQLIQSREKSFREWARRSR